MILIQFYTDLWGVSIYLGPFKAFGDVDLLISPVWLDEKWTDLQAIMTARGFKLVDEHEHEFQNTTGLCVAFAPETVLTRDGILDSLDEVVRTKFNDCDVKTLTPEQFKRAYIFSEKDGYRKNTRGKKDQEIIQLLEAYIAS